MNHVSFVCIFAYACLPSRVSIKPKFRRFHESLHGLGLAKPFSADALRIALESQGKLCPNAAVPLWDDLKYIVDCVKERLDAKEEEEEEVCSA